MDSEVLTRASLWGWLALGVLAYSGVYARLITWVMRHHKSHVIESLLVLSPIGVGGVVVMTTPAIGWQNMVVVMGALAIGAVPVVLLVGKEVLEGDTVRFRHDQEDE